MYFAGIDLHKRYLTLCILDWEGNVLRERRRLGTDALVAVPAEFDEPVSVALEATLHWAWLHDQPVTRGHRVEAAHAAQVKLNTRARCKTDPIDARKLADLLRTNLLPSIWSRTRRRAPTESSCAAKRSSFAPRPATYPEWLHQRQKNHILEVRPR